MTTIPDLAARQAALNPKHSFLIQAPAGSGKTELLTQRYLTLLASVSAPEKIIAITFTRKAQAEMKQRIHEALLLAEGPRPQEAHKQTTWQLARQALQQSQAQQWQLSENPARLRVLTIDALSAFLCQNLPLKTKISPELRISEQSEPLYQQAINNLFNRTNTEPELKNSLHHCLLQVDNRADYLVLLLTNLLQKRDQWLPHLIPLYNNLNETRVYLENSLKHIAESHLHSLSELLTQSSKALLTQLLAFSMNERGMNNETDISLDHQLRHLTHWQSLADLLLTQDGNWRKTVTKRQGFPTTAKNEKQQILSFIAEHEDDETLLAALNSIRLTPPIHYSEQQWRVLASLIQLLPQLLAELQWVFSQTGEIDFVEVNLAASRALGSIDDPSELALQLDYSIAHLLIDEFQDTSTTQYHLIEKLLAGWQATDGRSIFLVGDPMQSIYRFRQAEVGLFLKTRQHGIGPIKPKFLQLQANFRSNASLISWYNQIFSDCFPKQSDAEKGAISYHPSIAMQPNASSSLHCHGFIEQEAKDEAHAIATLAQSIDLDKESCAILVQSRAQLLEIMPALHQAGIPFQAVDIEPLASHPAIQDAIALTRAILHFNDRIAWLALLRSPICALTLTSLLALSEKAGRRTLWSVLHDCSDTLDNINEQKSVTHLQAHISHALATRHEQPFSIWLKQLWQDLGFHHLIDNEQDEQACQQYFATIAQFDLCEHELNHTTLLSALDKAYVQTPPTNKAVALMTIHKSKGLEFDHVILPNLDRMPVNDSPQLLLWLERPTGDYLDDLILAPLKSPDDKADAIYRYCQRAEKQKLFFEQARVFYVAATRAKQQLHLMAHLKEDKNGELCQAPRGSFLARFESHFHQQLTRHQTNPDLAARTKKEYNLIRLDTALSPPSSHQRLPSSPSKTQGHTFHLEAAGQNFTPRAIGEVVHWALHRLSLLSTQPSPAAIKSALLCRGVPVQMLEQAYKDCQKAIDSTQQSPRGQWILSKHNRAASEMSLHQQIDGQWQQFIIDRNFEDQGIHWVIDYKTSSPAPRESNEHFLASQKDHYVEQLERYATLISAQTNLPIRCGLYFPMVDLWCEWEPHCVGETHASGYLK